MTTLPDDVLADFAETILRAARELDPLGAAVPNVVRLTGTEILVLRWVDQNPGTSPSATAEATGLRRSNLSTALRELERKGMLERRANSADGRQVSLRPTELARRNVEVLRTWWTQRLRGVLASRAIADDVIRASELLGHVGDELHSVSRESQPI